MCRPLASFQDIYIFNAFEVVVIHCYDLSYSITGMDVSYCVHIFCVFFFSSKPDVSYMFFEIFFDVKSIVPDDSHVVSKSEE